MTTPSEVLHIWQEVDPEGTPTDRGIITALRAVWDDAEIEVSNAQTALTETAGNPFPLARWLNDCIARCEAAEDRYTRAWSAYCAARRELKMEAA